MKAILIAVTLATLTRLALAQDLGMKQHGEIRWACGGVGVEERAALAALRPQANLELLFVTAKRGGYLADVVIAVYQTDKTSPILQLTAEGPMCLMSTPKGNFRIEATRGGIQRSVRVAADGRHAQVVFGFPDEPWDGIKASEDEKRQAR